MDVSTWCQILKIACSSYVKYALDYGDLMEFNISLYVFNCTLEEGLVNFVYCAVLLDTSANGICEEVLILDANVPDFSIPLLVHDLILGWSVYFGLVIGYFLDAVFDRFSTLTACIVGWLGTIYDERKLSSI